MNSQSGEDQKHIFHREKPSVLFFASVNEEILSRWYISDATAASTLTSSGVAIVVYERTVASLLAVITPKPQPLLPAVPHRTQIGPNHCGSDTEIEAWQDGFSLDEDLVNPAALQGKPCYRHTYFLRCSDLTWLSHPSPPPSSLTPCAKGCMFQINYSKVTILKWHSLL